LRIDVVHLGGYAAAISPAPVENEVGVEIVAPGHRGDRNPGRRRLRDNLPLELQLVSLGVV